MRAAAPAARMLYFLLLVSALLIALNYSIRRHFNRLLPDFRIISVHGPLQLRRYPKLTVAEVRVTGGTSLALRSGRQLLDKYFRDEGISRFALPILAEKIDSADSIWSMAAVQHMHTHQHAAQTAHRPHTAHGTGMHMHCTWHCTCTAHGTALHCGRSTIHCMPTMGAMGTCTALWRSCLRYPSPRPPSAPATPDPTPKAETSRPLPRFSRWTWRQRPPQRTRPSSSRSCPRTAPSLATSTGPLARSKWLVGPQLNSLASWGWLFAPTGRAAAPSGPAAQAGKPHRAQRDAAEGAAVSPDSRSPDSASDRAARSKVPHVLDRPVSPDEMLARQKSEMLPLVNELCGELGSSKLSTAAGSKCPRWQCPRSALAPSQGAPGGSG